MAATGTPTPNIGLRIPQGTDPASVDDINYNSNLLDTKLGAVGNTSVQDQIDSLNDNKVDKDSRVVIDRNQSTTITDCDAVTDVGMYRVIGSTANRPSFIGYGTMIYMRSNDYHSQMVISTDGKNMAMRGKGTGSWNEWRQLVTTENLMYIVNLTSSTEVINFDTETRFYAYFNGSSSTGTKPWSTNNNGHLITFVRDSSNTVLQFARMQSGSNFNLYMRLKNSGTWGDWKSITFS